MFVVQITSKVVPETRETGRTGVLKVLARTCLLVANSNSSQASSDTTKIASEDLSRASEIVGEAVVDFVVNVLHLVAIEKRAQTSSSVTDRLVRTTTTDDTEIAKVADFKEDFSTITLQEIIKDFAATGVLDEEETVQALAERDVHMDRIRRMLINKQLKTAPIL
jgi:hypothetical protein